MQITKYLIEKYMGGFIDRLVEDKYTENLWEMYGTTEKIFPRTLVETAMRAKQGTPLERPFGTPQHFSPWYKLLFNPVHLFKMPTVDSVQVDTSVTLGPGASKPLTLDIPIMISGMSYGGALSKKAKIALARGASLMGTATNSGEAPLLEEEREAACYFIGQYNRGGWMTGDMLQKLDMVEIQVGQGAQAGAPMKTKSNKIGPEFRKSFHLNKGQNALIDGRLPGINSAEDFIELVKRLKEKVDVPVGLKFAATHHLEKELAIAVEAGVDFITVDGAEAGTHGGPTILEDHFGLPTLHALCRTVTFLEKEGLKDKISVIASGGLLTPGHYLKALALGADAVYIGTIAVMAMVSSQIKKTVPWEPPTELVLYSGKQKNELDVDKASLNLAYYLKSCVKEMELAIKALGKEKISEVDKKDLCALTEEVAKITGVELVYLP
ncbi:FMN-binding glutamate synthase family protein [Halothermothrix orenii]|uniref:Glutamate synthase (NADPH) large subunit n=1 Tax=Halothermothrix orenii (strain H 168 / OCM 544 / DSM 9562) TaxID=373903 RepID=B8CYW0_HALOH|nr:FMN-binding glutamate synthase family protein [Halothermothrix orenii]ACL70479.1 glutamate synthase (NADPH) large subunit [Halothermothrix orenii H 168]